MKKRSHDFRQQAKNALQGNWFIAVIAGIIASLFGATTFGGGSVSSSSSSSGSGSGTTSPDLDIMLEELLSNEVVIVFLAIFGTLVIILSILSLVSILVGGAVGIGYSKFNLDLIEGRPAKLRTLFGSFNQWTTALVARILRAIYIALWTLLFIIPGIIAGLSYSMVHYVMADNPHMSASEALEESKRLMDGNKWRLFCLDLSFIGWELLAIIFTLGIGMLWVIPYKEAAVAAFYRDICPAKVAESDGIDPIAPLN